MEPTEAIVTVNSIFSLDQEELKKLNELIQKHAVAWASEDLIESFRYTVLFKVHLLGVDVAVQIGDSDNCINVLRSCSLEF